MGYYSNLKDKKSNNLSANNKNNNNTCNSTIADPQPRSRRQKE